MRGGALFRRHDLEKVPVIIGVLLILGSTALVPESGRAARVSAANRRPKTEFHKTRANKRGKTSPAGRSFAKKPSRAGSPRKNRAKSKHARRHRIGVFTAYAAKTGDGDSYVPDIAADQTDLKTATTCVVANNKLRFGTKIRVEGLGICEVRDRFGKKVRANRFDLYMNDRPTCAVDFGRKRLKYAIVEVGKKKSKRQANRNRPQRRAARTPLRRFGLTSSNSTKM